MNLNWNTLRGPAFKFENKNGEIKYSKEFIDHEFVENTRKLSIASDGISKYDFEKNHIGNN